MESDWAGGDRKNRIDDAFKSAEESISSLRARTESDVLDKGDRKEDDSYYAALRE